MVQLFHPAFERLRLGTGTDLLEPLRQTGATFGQVVVGRIQIVVGGLQIKNGGGHLHRNRCRWRRGGAHHAIDGRLQGLRQYHAFRVQLGDGFAHCGKLLAHHLDAVGISAGQCRPGFGRSSDALARQCQQRRIEASELLQLVIDRRMRLEAIRLQHRLQCRRTAFLRWTGLPAEKRQVLRQTLRRCMFPLGQAGILLQHTRGGAACIDVQWHQRLCDGFEIPCRNGPEGVRIR